MTIVVVADTLSLQWFCGSRARTSTLIVSPRSPLPGCERSSVAAVAPAIVVPLRFQVYSKVSGSPSGSAKPVVAAVTTWFVRGVAGAIETVPSTGVELVLVTTWPPRATALVPPLPSEAVTSTSTRSPSWTWPARSKRWPVAPGTAVPLTSHWYW